MELKGRLKLIAEKVTSCKTLYDIGTDHAYVPIFLALNKICDSAVVTDIKKGPLITAQGNINEFNLGDLVKTRQGYGLDPVEITEDDEVVISGMGGLIMRDILDRGLEKLKRTKKIILQPMKAIPLIREWLLTNSFEIMDEELVNEGAKVYDVIVAKWFGNILKFKNIDLYVGKMLIERNDPLLIKYLSKENSRLDKIISGLKMSTGKEKEIYASMKLKEEISSMMRGGIL